MATIAELVREAYSHWDDAEILSRVGRELHDRNRLDLSREVLGRALQLDPRDAEAWTVYAFAHLRGYMPDRGREVLREGVEKSDSDHVRAALASFTTDAEERQTLQARLAESGDPAVRAGLLSSRLWSGDKGAWPEMQALYEEHRENPDVRDTWLWLIFASGGRPGGEPIDLREAIAAADRRIAAEPGRVGGTWMKAQLLQVARDWDGVLETTGAGLARFPDEETLMHMRACAFREKGDLERAAQCFARAAGMKPSFAGARAELGKVYEAQGKLDLAEEVFREVPRVNEEYAAGPVHLAAFLGRRGRWAEAETLFLEAWGRMQAWQQARVKQRPDAAPLLARPRVKAAVGG